MGMLQNICSDDKPYSLSRGSATFITYQAVQRVHVVSTHVAI